nr:SRPBCC domain-containing protein [Nitratireductor pacificus]
MTPEFRVSARISKPVEMVFDAVTDPAKLSGYFTTIGGASAPLTAGATVLWWGEVPVEVDEVIDRERIVLRWDGSGSQGKKPHKTRIQMDFRPLDDGGTLVTIMESGWQENSGHLRASYMNCEGWTQMLCCLKAFLEHGINLRQGYYSSELRGEPAREPEL